MGQFRITNDKSILYLRLNKIPSQNYKKVKIAININNEHVDTIQRIIYQQIHISLIYNRSKTSEAS